MSNFDPRLIALFCLIFIALGAFSIVTGTRRMQEARAQGQRIVWYKQIGILTGVEYILLAFTFLFSVSISAGWLPKSLGQLLVPLYIIILLASLLLTGLVLFQGFTASRRNRQAAPARRASTPARTGPPIEERPQPVLSAEERALQTQKRRERRQKAAEARRRRAGKA
ncbi:MAG TPA: hypothetical protein VGU68_04920 [Ktedonobacteraceae bacterium]|nr:hypothetical protein [Ktedonobacteraceae bacterium]HEV2659918.1 hypothetical protein [Ktedonobacteraceae bacterium]